MKKLLLFIAVICSFSSFAQPGKPPAPNTAPNAYVWTGQMLNTANTYVGSRLDTATNSTPLYLSVCQTATTGLPVVYPLFGSGTMSFLLTGIKISGTPAGTAILEESYDGVIYGPVHTSNNGLPATATTGTVTTTYTNTTPDVLTIANVATVQGITLNLPTNPAPFYRWNITGSGTQTSSWRGFWCFTRSFFYTN